MPKRIQLKRTKGWRMPENTVKVDRTTKWGNPFAAIASRSLDEVVADFRRMATHPNYHDVSELRGKNLACWCKPGAPCHADVLLELANATAHDKGEPQP
jgi:hypothetical protein